MLLGWPAVACTRAPRSAVPPADVVGGATPDTADAAQAEDAVPPDAPQGVDAPESAPSSEKACLCWPTGEDCDLFDGKGRIAADPAMKCPDGEVCIGGSNVVIHKGSQFGICRRACADPGATVPASGTCVSGEVCSLTAIVKANFEPEDIAQIGACVPNPPYSWKDVVMEGK